MILQQMSRLYPMSFLQVNKVPIIQFCPHFSDVLLFHISAENTIDCFAITFQSKIHS